MTLRECRSFLRFLALLVCSTALAAAGYGAPTDVPAPFTPMSLAVGSFATSGLEASLGVGAAKLLRQGLAGSPLLNLKESVRVQRIMGSDGARILANKPGVAQAVSDQLTCRVLVYGVLWADPKGAQFLQLTGIDCRPRVARLYVTPPLAWPARPDEQQPLLLSALQAVLPPVGRVLATITVDGKTEIQVFPFAKTPLRTDTSYLAFRSVPPLGTELPPDRPEHLPPLWNGDYSGRFLTAAARLDDVIGATPEDTAQIRASDMVGLALTKQVVAVPSTGRLVLSDPPFAQVIKDGRVLGLTPLLVPADTMPGDFNLALTNYEKKPITLAAVTGLLADQFALKELPLVGALRVVSEPDGATVLLDGKQIGKTPLIHPNVQPGKYTVSVRLAGWENAEREIEVARAQAAEAAFTLERQMRGVRVVSQPKGAQVTWDGQDLGKAPAAIARTPVGAHTVKLSLTGYDEVERQVEIQAGGKPAELTFPMVKLVGKLRVTSEPAGAQITVAGKARGVAPVELVDLTPGEYQIAATLAGYREAKQAAIVKVRETAHVKVVMARRVGVIHIKTVPAGAKITLNGQDRGTTPATLEDIPAGDHNLKLESPNLRPWEAKVTVKDEQTTQVQVGLLPLTVDMGTQPGVQPLPPTAPTKPPVPDPFPGGTASGPGGRDFEGTEDTRSFGLLELGNGQARSWTMGLLRKNDVENSPSDQIRLDFQPHADGSLTVAIRTKQALPAKVDLERNGGTVVVNLPGLRALHNPAGVRIKEGPIHGVRLTNAGPEGELQLTLTLASRAQVTASGTPEATGELLLKIRRPLLMGNSKQVALTFDDLPFPGHTERLLKLLREYRVVATMFVIGHKAANMPTVIRQAHEDGHSIQNHSQTHPKLTTLSPAQVKFELQRCNEVIKQITGKTPTFYRAPGGRNNAEVIRVARALGLATAGWDVNVHDYDTPEAQVIADRVVQGCHAGDIILLHDGVVPTRQALPDIIGRLRRAGFIFVTMDKLMAAPR